MYTVSTYISVMMERIKLKIILSKTKRYRSPATVFLSQLDPNFGAFEISMNVE